MIRRDVQLADGAVRWMLISQVEHARISAQLAERWVGRFSAAELAEVRREVLAAILHHDDGWADWERAPRLDPELGRPLSFMELGPTEAIAIWSRSIVSALRHGPLAAWMVAGHFSRLLEKSDTAESDCVAAEWLGETRRRREAWLANWQAGDPVVRSSDIAEEALQWLWAFDEVSLWFCCNCPSDGETPPTAAKPYVAGRGTPIEMELVSRRSVAPNETAPGLAGTSPYRFDREPIDLEATGRVVPVAKYRSPQEMLAASQPRTIHWRLGR
jgi:hypothetical protein